MYLVVLQAIRTPELFVHRLVATLSRLQGLFLGHIPYTAVAEEAAQDGASPTQSHQRSEQADVDPVTEKFDVGVCQDQSQR